MVNFPFINQGFEAVDSFLFPAFVAPRILRIRRLSLALVRCPPGRSIR